MTQVKDDTYTVIADLVFEVLDAIFMYRHGIGNEDPELAFAARAKVAKVWTGRHHPSYQETEMTDNIKLAMMPTPIRTAVLKC